MTRRAHSVNYICVVLAWVLQSLENIKSEDSNISKNWEFKDFKIYEILDSTDFKYFIKSMTLDISDLVPRLYNP